METMSDSKIRNRRAAFIDYIAKHVKDDERAQTLLQTADELLPAFIRSNFNSKFTSLYDVTDRAVLKDYTEQIILDPVLKAEDSSVNSVGYVATLTLYRRFLKKAALVNANQIEKDGSVVVSEPAENGKYVEGAILQETAHADKRERNREAREACIAYFRTKHHGRVVCECCGFDFEKAYGALGKDFIEVHHRFPLSQTEGEHDVDPKKNLVPLCSNCHAMIHRLARFPGDCMSLDELKRRYIGKVYHDE